MVLLEVSVLGSLPKYYKKIIYGELSAEIGKYYGNYVKEKKWKS